MNGNGNGHVKACLEISGIPLQCDADRFKKTLQDRGTEVFNEKIHLKFLLSTQPERRVTARVIGLQPDLIPWITEVVRLALSDCAYPKYEIFATLARN